MEDRVPGGRQRSTELGDVTAEEETNGEYPRLSPTHRNVSHSLPKVVNNSTKIESLQNDCTESTTLDRKKKSRTPSFKNFVNRMVRNVSNTMRRSQSVDRSRSRSKFGSVQSSLDDSAIDTTCTTPKMSMKFDDSQLPGVVGIKNHGNTCFMNAVLQCLCHTELLAEYFVTDQYKQDIKRNNKRNAKKYGTKGELTEQLAQLLKSLWSGLYKAEYSSDFKNIVGKYGAQYRGFAQHDAQEFLLWLLDKVHEDLNIATKKKYRANKSSHGRSDESVAAEALANHMRHNNSFVYDLFQAVYRSSLTCTNCHRQSNTFDPFLSVSLPIPQKTKRPVYVTVVYLDEHPRQVRIGLLLNQTDTVKELRQTLAADTKIPESQLILTEIYYDGFHRTFCDSNPLSELHETDNIYAIETPTPLVEENVENPDSQYLASKYLLLLILNKQGTGSQGKRFGSPLVMQVPRDVTYMELQNDILHNMVACLRDESLSQTTEILFRLRVMDGLPGKCYLPHEVQHVLYMPTVDRALSAHGPGSGPQHLKLIVEWDQQTKESMIGSAEDIVEEHASVQQVKLAHQQPILGTLDECFRLYTQEEQLVGDDAWHCPNCKRRQQGTIKSLSLWNLPDVLVIHLKRFKQLDERRRTKLNTLITFPENRLDMSQHISRRNNMTPLTNWSPWRRHKNLEPSADDFIYDLYAVCNHYGNMQGGHYTAFCKNPADGKWYVYDDTQVKETAEDQIVTRAAYLLFYQRRSVHNSVVQNHNWIFNFVKNFNYKQPKYKPPTRLNQSHDALLDTNYDGFTEEQEIEVDEEGLRPVERGAITYATMQRVPAKLRSRTWTGSEAMDAAAEICSCQSIGNLDAMSLSHQINSPTPSATQSREDVASVPHTAPVSRDATPLHERGPPMLVNRPLPTPRTTVSTARHTKPQPPQPKPRPHPPPPPKYNPNPTAGFHPALVAMATAQRSNPPTPSHSASGSQGLQAKYVGTFQPSQQMSPSSHAGARYPMVNGTASTLPHARGHNISSTPASSTLTLPNMTSTPETMHRTLHSQMNTSNHTSELNNPANWPNACCMKESCV